MARQGKHVRASVPPPTEAELKLLRSFADVSRETLARLETYAALLEKWQAAHNLVASASLGAFWTRHAIDSAQLMPHVAPGQHRIVDLGSGAGFPGLILALLLPEGTKVTLVEADRKKGLFLNEVIRATGAPAVTVTDRIEKWAETAEPPDLITARALAPLPKLLDLAAPLFGAGTEALFLKGRDATRELTEAAKYRTFEARSFQSATDPEAAILHLKGLRI